MNVSPTQSAVAASAQSLTADGTQASIITVTVEDAAGQPLSGVSVTLGVSGGGNTITQPGPTNASGTATGTVVSTQAGIKTVTVVAGGVTLTQTITLTFTPGAADHLAFTAQPSTVGAGEPITPGVAVSVLDAHGNLVAGASGVVTMTLATNPHGATLFGTTSTSAVAGVATFADLRLDNLGGGYALGASASGLTAATSAAFSVTAGPPNFLFFAVNPPATGVAGLALTPALQVELRDAFGHLATTTAPVTIALTTNPGGATLSGAATVNASGGVATFAGLSLDKVGTGYVLTASSSGITSATSGPFDIVPGAAAALAFAVQPAGGSVGNTLSPAIQVSVRDAGGNLVTGATNAVTIALGANPGGTTLGGTTTVSASGGVATFSNLSLGALGTGYTLVASASGLTGATSASFNVSQTPTHLSFSVQPSNVAQGVSIAPAVQVTVLDAGNNVATGASAAVTLALSSNPGSATLSGTLSVTPVNGVATFSNLSLDKLGTGYTLAASASGLTGATSGSFNVVVGPAAKLEFTVQPAGATIAAPIAPAVQVTVQDAAGNTVTGATNAVTIAIGNNPSSAALTGTTTVSAAGGVATFSSLALGTAGNGFTLVASASGLTGATSASFDVTAAPPGPPTKLAFAVQPSAATGGVAIAPAVKVAIQDANGTVVTTSTASVTIAIGSNPAAGSLSGTLTQSAVNGVATFADLSIDKAGTGYTLAAASSGLTGATSASFNITAGPAAKLAFTSQPAGAQAGVGMSFTVTVQDAGGNAVGSATSSITVAIGNNAGGGTLSGTLTRSASGGAASFTGVSIDKAASGYTLAASASGLTGATSSAFAITPAAAAGLAFVVQPTDAANGLAIAPAVQVAVRDAFGNTVTSATNAVTVAIGNNPSGGALSGTGTQNASGGVATFANLSIDLAGDGYTLSATASGLTAAASNAFNVVSGAPEVLSRSISPRIALAGASLTLTVRVKDVHSNLPGTNGVTSVQADLSAVGGSATTALSAGTIIDAQTQDYTVVVPTTGLGVGAYELTVTVNNVNSLSASTVAYAYVYTGTQRDVGSGGTFATVQEGIDAAASGDAVVLRSGTYTSVGNPASGARNKNLTIGKAILLISANGAAATTIDCQGAGRSFNLNASAETNSTVIAGLTLANGGSSALRCITSASPSVVECTISGNTNGDHGGGAICTGAVTPRFLGCTFQANTLSSFSGSAIYSTGGATLTIRDCAFVSNVAGNGVIRLDNASAAVTRCTFTDNSFYSLEAFTAGTLTVSGSTFRRTASGPANSSVFSISNAFTLVNSTVSGFRQSSSISNAGTSFNGCTFQGNPGGITLFGGTVTNCNFVDNGSDTQQATTLSVNPGTVTGSLFQGNRSGGGGNGILDLAGNAAAIDCVFEGNVTNGSGGAVFQRFSGTSIRGCTFFHNQALNGGAIYLAGNNCTISNCLIFDNTATGNGGGVYVDTTNSSPATAILNSTIAGNTAAVGGGLYLNICLFTLKDSIVFDNLDAGAAAQIFVRNNASVVPTFSFCDIANGPTDIQDDGLRVNGGNGFVAGVSGNKSVDPRFVTGAHNTYYLAQLAGEGSASPCVNAGSDTAANLQLNARTTRTDNVGDSGTVDMGFHSLP